MSFLSSLFSWDDDDDDDEEEEETPRKGASSRQPEGAITGELYTGMTLDVSGPDGSPLLKGKITALTSQTMTIERLPGGLAFKTCPLEAQVTARGRDQKMVPVALRAAVQSSSRTALKLKDIQIMTHAENRENFRLPIDGPVSLYRQDDEQMKNPEECRLTDVSTGGICVQSEYIHMEDEVLRIRLQLEDYTPLTFLGQIVRCEELPDGRFRYGILFAQLTESETTNLNRILFNLQMGVKRTHMRSEAGHW